MLYLIKTAGKKGKAIANRVCSKAKVVFWDANCKLWNTTNEYGPIVSFAKIKEYIDNNQDYSVIIPEFLVNENTKDELINLGVEIGKTYIALSDDIIPAPPGGEFLNFSDYFRLPYLEYHVIDRCNLNCKGCAVFSPLVKEDGKYEYDVFEKDIVRLKQLIHSIDRIRIMGGEPFLDDELYKYVAFTRHTYPSSELIIVTNGSVLDRTDKKTWNSIKENQVKIQISSYPVLYKRIDELVGICSEYGVDVEVIPVTSFKPILRKKHEYPFDNTKLCQCNNLRDGKISSCAISMYGKHYNQFFGRDLPFESGVVDIYNQELNGEILTNILNTPSEICKYCQQYLWSFNERFGEDNRWNFYSNDTPLESDWGL